jgi:hypothetical protein
MANLRGVDLLGHIADMLINERLYRDLREATDVNNGLDKLDELGLAPAVLESVKGAIGWAGRKRFEIVSIQPPEPLRGNPSLASGGSRSARTRSTWVASGHCRFWASDGGDVRHRLGLFSFSRSTSPSASRQRDGASVHRLSGAAIVEASSSDGVQCAWVRSGCDLGGPFLTPMWRIWRSGRCRSPRARHGKRTSSGGSARCGANFSTASSRLGERHLLCSSGPPARRALQLGPTAHVAWRRCAPSETIGDRGHVLAGAWPGRRTARVQRRPATAQRAATVPPALDGRLPSA